MDNNNLPYNFDENDRKQLILFREKYIIFIKDSTKDTEEYMNKKINNSFIKNNKIIDNVILYIKSQELYDEKNIPINYIKCKYYEFIISYLCIKIKKFVDDMNKLYKIGDNNKFYFKMDKELIEIIYKHINYIKINIKKIKKELYKLF